jgi:hypothetical protein
MRHAARQLPAWLIFDVGQMKKHLGKEAADALLELEQFVYQATADWQSYWSLDSIEAHGRFDAVFKRHQWWHSGACTAYIFGTIISLAKFFERNSASVNIWHFAQCLDRFPEWKAEAKSISDILQGCATASRDVAVLRNNYYAHRSRNLSFKDMLKKTSLRYDDFPALIQTMADALNVVVMSIGGSEVHPKSIAERTAQEMGSLLLALDR